MSTLLKWAQNTQGKLIHKSSSNGHTNGTSGERKWLHPPDTLQKGHIAYLVKFLGNTVVDQAKGIEVVKEGIRKLQFNQQLRKSESGGNAAKNRKVELTISVDGVAIQEPKTHNILHQFPLHRISYCADDKGEKKFFSFIAKQPNQVNNDAEDIHECFVFISDKLAEEITLTIGQAFELAYKRFLETSGKDLETQKRLMIAQQRIKNLESENNVYKKRLEQLASFLGPRLDQFLRQHKLKSITESPPMTNSSSDGEQHLTNGHNGHSASNRLLSNGTNASAMPPTVPPRKDSHDTSAPIVGTKLEGLLMQDDYDDDDFDPRSFENRPPQNGNTPLIAPPPSSKSSSKRSGVSEQNKSHTDNIFDNIPFSSTYNNFHSKTINDGIEADPFGMGEFNLPSNSVDIENAIGLIDKRILEMKNGFSRGISFGNDDFSLESLDPLKN